MKIGVATDRIELSKTRGVRGEIFFSPLFEMMASMHVICNPEHHTGRLKWWNELQEKADPVLLSAIKELGNLTNEWLIPLDFAQDELIVELDVPEAILTLQMYPMSKWKRLFDIYGKSISLHQKKKILEVLERYYETIFKEELFFLEALLTRSLKKLFQEAKQNGYAKVLEEFHEHLIVKEDELVLLKNKEYHFSYQEIESIQLTGSTFFSPHLILGESGKKIYLVKHFYAENVEQTPPQELIRVYNGLADGTRLQILKLLKKEPNTTQALAKKLFISEAAVSKQLKVLTQGGLVEKKRKGIHVYYYMVTEKLDFLTYMIFEYLN